MVVRDECRLRIDPYLVDKFKRLPGGINEVGVRIVRDIGLRYEYDKREQVLDIIGPDPEILSLAVETLRFWLEDDEFPHTGVTCQVGYPNRSNVIWRFHGDYAKKFDHLFTQDIRKVKLIPTVNIKAVPSKKRIEYVELYCHFNVYHQVKDEVLRLSFELSKVFQENFFVPKSDHQKAWKFAQSKSNDTNVLYALKEYPDKIRVWIFARDPSTVFGAKQEWIHHIRTVARDTEYSEKDHGDKDSMKSAHFFGIHRSSVVSETTFPIANNVAIPFRQHPSVNKNLNTSRRTSLNNSFSKDKKSPRGVNTLPKYDNVNFPRPSDFVYPIKMRDDAESEIVEEPNEQDNPFAFDASHVGDLNQHEVLDKIKNNPLASQAKWVAEGDAELYQARRHSRPMPPNRIYVHHQVDQRMKQFPQQQQMFATERDVNKVVHPETNLIARERYKPGLRSNQVLTAVTDAKLAPSIRKRGKNVRPGAKATQKGVKVRASTRSRPVLQVDEPPPNVRYHINVNGLDILMYYKSLAKLDNVDALVNSVNTDLKQGGMVATAVFDMAGKQVMDEIAIHLQLNGPLRVAENIVTSAGRIPTLGIIHVAGPVWENYVNISEEECARDLHTAVYRALKTAEKHKYRKIGMPVISAEPYFGVPKDLVAEVYVKALVDYSMGMGPLYPVLEIHLVDTDAQMLTYIKEAYERWATSTTAVDITQRSTTDNPLHTPTELSKRAKSAVMLKEVPTHTSQNMVTFTEQSYTKDNNQIWTFEVLKKLTVHVYTGSVVKEDDVEAIVCAVDSNMKGSLAKHVLFAGGRRYENSLKRARSRQRNLREGEVLVCDGGDLDVDVVLHSVVSRPIYSVNQINLSRLDSINTLLLYAANKMGLTSLAMPLIGTGRLREKFEVEQCSLQLVDNIIEVCLSTGNSSTLRELHLVNANPIMTQSLTQALRTRAHTKLRMEKEDYGPSRQDILTTNDTHRSTPDLQTRNMTARSMIGQIIGAGNTEKVVEQEDDDRVSVNKNTEHHIETGVIITSENSTKDTNVDEGHYDKSTEKARDKERIETKDESNDKRRGEKKNGENDERMYLSKNNLKAHEKRVTNNWIRDSDHHDNKQPHGKSDRKTDRRHNHLDPIEYDQDRKRDQTKNTKPSWIDPNGRPAVIPEKLSKVHKRKLQNLQKRPEVIHQRSRAESYKSMFEKRRKAIQMQKEDAVKHRRSKSQSGMTNKEIADKVLEGFKKERIKLENSGKSRRGGGDEDVHKDDREERKKFTESLNEAENFYTRKTGERYRMKNKRDGSKEFEEYERLDRVDVRNSNVRRGSKTDRVARTAGQRNKGYQTERFMMAHEREDMYMMDMDFNEKVIDSRKYDREINGFENIKDNGTSERSGNVRRDRKSSIVSQRMTEENNSRKREEEDYIAPPGAGRTDADLREDYIQTENLELQELDGNGYRKRNNESPRTYRDTKPVTEKSARITRTSAKYTDSSFPETDLPLPEQMSAVQTSTRAGNQIPANVQDYGDDYKDNDSFVDDNVKPSINAINENIVENESQMESTEENRQQYKHLSQKNIEASNPNKQYPVHESKENNVFINPNDMLVEQTNENNENGREFRSDLKAVNEHANISQSQLNMQENIYQQPANPEDVTIRDKIKLEIDVVDRIDDKQIQREKQKIKRFWEVVGNEEEKEMDMFEGEDGIRNEKMIIGKVTKERKMSARSKQSKKSTASTVTHNVGNYNVTVEVGH